MGGEVTVYSGAPVLGAAGMLGISWKLNPGMSKPGICMPRMGGIPPIILDISLDIIEEEDELENEDDDIELIFDDDEFMFMDPMLDIILPIMSSIPRDCIPPIPPIDIMSGIPPIDIMPPGMGPPEDIIVDDDDEEDDDLKLEIVDPSSDCVVAAILWLLALSSFLTATPSSVT